MFGLVFYVTNFQTSISWIDASFLEIRVIEHVKFIEHKDHIYHFTTL